jgi:hypothetical protein
MASLKSDVVFTKNHAFALKKIEPLPDTLGSLDNGSSKEEFELAI